jgi:hypothetical protein
MIVVLVLSGVALMVTPAVHAMVREANLLYALGIAAARSDDPAAATEPIRAQAASMMRIPGPMDWAMLVGGGVSVLAGALAGAVAILGPRGRECPDGFGVHSA